MHTVFRRNDYDVPKSNVGDSVFDVYYSKYVNDMKLESQVRVPRPCAYESILLPYDNKYYRGALAFEYSISDTEYTYVLGKMMFSELEGPSETVIVDQYGRNASSYANFTLDDRGTITYFTDKLQDIGNQSVTIRHCDSDDRLYEITL